jgi:hypothetical protein
MNFLTRLSTALSFRFDQRVSLREQTPPYTPVTLRKADAETLAESQVRASLEHRREITAVALRAS